MPLNEKFNAASQRIIPQKTLTWIFKIAANCSAKPWKNWMIRRFIRKYGVNIQESVLQNAEDFKNFNDFFIRKIKPELRPITFNEKIVVSPVDGRVRQIGTITHGKIFNAKGHAFTLYELLGGNLERSAPFLHGTFSNLYLAPCDYHCIHMPYAGKLKSMTYVPGKLFPVKGSTADAIPNVFSINERVVLIFDTAIGPMAMILVGATIVGNLHVVWEGDLPRQKKIQHWDYSQRSLNFKAGDEVGHFKLGSTVITIFTNKDHTVEWKKDLDKQLLKYGQPIGDVV